MSGDVAPARSKPSGAVGRHLWIADNADRRFHNKGGQLAAGILVLDKENAHSGVRCEISDAAQNFRRDGLICAIGAAVRVAAWNRFEKCVMRGLRRRESDVGGRGGGLGPWERKGGRRGGGL